MKPDLLQVLEEHQQFQKTNLVRLLRQTVRLITTEISRTLVKHGHQNLSARHLNVFENLETAENNIITLANRAGISKQAMSKLVKEITQEGYAVVVHDKRDHRLQVVQLTEKGMDFLRLLQTEIQKKYQDLLDSGLVEEEKMSDMYQTLTGISKFLDRRYDNGGEVEIPSKIFI
ncbi:MAG: hypothetical protein JNL70_10860 [Saprospiraceae bacterium]|nr:hypothetical protein [Saprospiraceae bacterium]